PFSGRDEWELGQFLYTNFTQSQINGFLKLKWVRDSFCLDSPIFNQLEIIDAIPKGPSWHCTTISYDGYLMEEPICLYWHNALEVVQELFRNPIFSLHMEYNP
ncbi:hypothetical protein J3A83DRAFT_4080397, partial [Scleroderma citrinum]